MPLLGVTVNISRLLLTIMVHANWQFGVCISEPVLTERLVLMRRHSLFLGPFQLTFGWGMKRRS